MDKVQLAGFLVFTLGGLLSFALPLIGVPVLILGLLIMIVSVVIERYNDIKKGDLK